MTTVSLFLIIDESHEFKETKEDFSFKIQNPPLSFTTREEAELYRKPNQKIIERDGCPIEMALNIVRMTRIIIGKPEIEGC